MQADGRIFVSHLAEGLFVLEGARLQRFTDATARDGRGVAWMKKERDRWLMVTTRGLSEFDGERISPLGREAGEFITHNVLSCATSFSNGDLCVGTLNGGLAVVSPDGSLKSVFTSARRGKLRRQQLIRRTCIVSFGLDAAVRRYATRSRDRTTTKAHPQRLIRHVRTTRMDLHQESPNVI